ncbi:hypothetical protein AVEN_71652-1 [Araneus ventricosus]|uniref:Uncharacterized protein n=1 Tax=Araneus ventricosus TaxID=182803 RepID=A0A4Y2KVW9_ARAVE|nr:hypothetical protein AVEN_71652-1 [Araneus ventricosus]
MENKQTDIEENSKNGDVSDTEECVLSIQKSFTQHEEKVAKCLDGCLVDFRLMAQEPNDHRVTEEDILSEITDEMENDNDDTDPSESLIDIPGSSSIGSVLKGICF